MAPHVSPNRHWLSSRSTISTQLEDVTDTKQVGSEKSSADKLFACPYLKRDPNEYAETQTCSQSGWTTIHGLRQHVYRCHILPIKCSGCSQTFDSSRVFAQHLRAVPECDQSVFDAEEPLKGLESLLRKIQPAKASTENDLDEKNMWRAIYANLFPNDPKENIPCPYHEKQGMPIAISPYGSNGTISGESSVSSIRIPEPVFSGNSQRESRERIDIMSRSSTSSLASQDPTQQVSLTGQQQALSISDRHPCQSGSGSDDGSIAECIGEKASNMHQAPETLTAYQQVQPSTKRDVKKKLRDETLEAQVLAFQAWEKPHRTDEHITPGVYRGFWIWLARCLTFYIPSWFLEKHLKMNDFRQRLAFRQKVLFCLVLAAIYALICYFLVIQPMFSCVVKVSFGMIPHDSTFCAAVRNIIYVYMGLGGAFMLLVAICVCGVRYTSRSFEEHDALLVMQIPCYNEDEFTLRRTIESCVQSSYEKKRKLLFVVADGTVAADGQKPTYRILLEDIFDHQADLELGIDSQSHSYTSFDGDGASENRASCHTGHYRGVPYVIVIKTGRDDEENGAKPGNRGKRDSQLLAYNFFHYVNYRRFWNPLFENLEYKIRTCLSIDARDAQYMLAIDCDTEVDRTGISYLVDRLQKDPKLVGACGYTGVSNTMSSFIASSQVFEYWLTHAVLKAVESMCSSVFVLSGCFTIYRLKWSNSSPAILHPLLLEDYAGSYNKTLHEHNLLSIGEDRYLSTLAIRYFGADCRLRYFSAATCKTVVPDKLSVLLDQRRRWTNSLIHCHFAHLNVPPFEASLWTHVRLLFVLFCELFMVFILPLALPAGVVLAVVSVLLTPYAWAILLAFLLIPLVLCILCMDWTYIPFYLPFFPMISVFSIVIPIYSVWNQDNIQWGKTRGA